MKPFLPAVLAVGCLTCVAPSASGMGMEQFGPVSERNTVNQPGWPNGMLDMATHASRVYSRWVNGGEDFHYNASTTDELEQLIQLFAQMNLREHLMIIKPGNGSATAFGGEKKIASNVHYRFPGRLYQAVHLMDGMVSTFEPTLTIYLDPGASREWWERVELPNNLAIECEIGDWPRKGLPIQPKRDLWHARVQFDTKEPAADFEHHVSVRATLWREDLPNGVYLGTVDHEGVLRIAFSDHEIFTLRSGSANITLTKSGWRVTANRNDTALDFERMSIELPHAGVTIVP